MGKMGKIKKPADKLNVFREKLHYGLVQEIKIKKKLIDTESEYQKIEIFDTYSYGRVMALDGVVQITEKDESAYSEMLVHPAINLIKKPKNILIIGGGDGAVAEEVLKYEFIVDIDLVDIDPEVIRLSKKYFKKVNKDSLNNKKVNIYNMDAFLFTHNTKKKYDLIIADRPDPVGFGKNLFLSNFYKNISDILSNDGLAVFQSGVIYLQKKETSQVCKRVQKFFNFSGILFTVVPSYIGGFMALVWASNKKDFNKIKNYNLKNYNIKTDYFNQDVFKASFAVPEFIKSILNNSV